LCKRTRKRNRRGRRSRERRKRREVEEKCKGREDEGGKKLKK